MKNRRLGKFNFCDYYISWVSIVLLLLFSITSILLYFSFWIVIFPLLYAISWLCVILIPYGEYFSIGSEVITVFLCKKKRTIPLPMNLTLIVSYADVCPPLAIHTAIGQKTHILSGKISVSILKEMPVQNALECIHRNHIQKYTASSIEAAFDDYHYIYSFVCNQSLFDALVANRKCLVIVPESLSKAISFDSSTINICIDQGH